MKRKEIHAWLSEICDLIIAKLPDIEKTRYEVMLKEDRTPVTKSDLLIEEIVANEIRKKLPNALFIGEESFKDSSIISSEYTIILDPIDGTENFCSGLREWGVSFSLWKEGAHLGSFLLMPEMGIRLITGDDLLTVNSRITGLSSSMSDSLITEMREPGEYRMFGCAVYNFYNVIRGSFRKFVNPKGAYIWDVLPGMMIALEHGCSVHIEGKVYRGNYVLDPKLKYRFEILR